MRLLDAMMLVLLLGCGAEPSSSQEDPAPDVVLGGMVKIPGGMVRMGPRHGVSPPPETIAQPPVQSRVLADQQPWVSKAGMGLPPRYYAVSPFWIDVSEVTKAQYSRFLKETGYRLPHVAETWAQDGWNWTGPDPSPGTEEHPVVMLSWYDAREYCKWAGKRLPTEAQWLLAALGPAEDARRYPWGSEYDGDRLNHGRREPPNFDDSDGYERTSPVGSFPKGRSPYGLVDAFGNAWEYTADRRVDDWADMASSHGKNGVDSDPRTLGPGLRVAVRGGSYYFDLSEPEAEWAAFAPESRRKSAGLRCARPVPAQ